MRRKGFSLAEVLAGVAILSIVVAVPLSLRFANLTEEELAVREAESLALWLENAFLRAQATKQRLELRGSGSLSEVCEIKWISGEEEFYKAGERARFFNMPSKTLSYSPMSSTNSPFGMTIRVLRASDQSNAVPVRYVIVSRFARVRVSKTLY